MEDIEDIYLNYVNKKTGKNIGAIQVCPREIRTWECVFPATAKKEIKKRIKELAGKNKHCAVHFGFFKKDKFVNGEEFL